MFTSKHNSNPGNLLGMIHSEVIRFTDFSNYVNLRNGIMYK